MIKILNKKNFLIINVIGSLMLLYMSLRTNLIKPDMRGEAIQICVIFPIFEEIIFRGIFLGKLKNRTTEIKALTIVSLIFFALHFKLELIGVIGSFIFGVIYLLADIKYCIFWHIINNTTVMINQYSEDQYIIMLFNMIFWFSNLIIGLKFLYDYYKKCRIDRILAKLGNNLM